MDMLERRLRAMEMILAERLALDAAPVLVQLEDNIRASRQEAAEVQDTALELVAQARGFDAYSAGIGVPSPEEEAVLRS